MELKQPSSVLSTVLILVMNSILSTALPHPDHYGDHLSVHEPFHNAIVDYYSKPQYAFGYEIDGLDSYFRELSHGRWEIRDGDVTQGQYRVLLPDGRIQIVSYIADKFGYRPTIKYINKGVLPPPPPSFANVKVPHLPPPPPTIVHVEEAVPVQAPIPVFHAAPVPVHDPYIGGTYGAAYGYGFDPFLALGTTNTNTNTRGRQRVARKRALLYDRTLFRKDVERKRRSGQSSASAARATNKVPVAASLETRGSSLSPSPSPATYPITVSVVASPAGTKQKRRLSPGLNDSAEK